MYDTDEKVTKYRVEVQVALDSGTEILGWLFTKPMQRVSDLLNDPRTFLPLQTTDGRIVHLAKASITKVTQVDQSVHWDAFVDPFTILGVPETADDATLKQAYHGLCAEYHPDRLMAFGLSSELIGFANARLIRIIDAYNRVQATRKAAANGANGHTSNDVTDRPSNGRTGQSVHDPLL